MKNLVIKTAGMIMAAAVFTGIPASAAETTEHQEIIEMEACTAVDFIGGIPDYIQGPDREDLEVMLATIDELSAAGRYEEADAVWGSVFELLDMYREVYGSEDEFEPEPEPEDPDQWIFEEIQRYEETIMRYEAGGDFEKAEALRAELEAFLAEVFGEQDPHMEGHDPDVDHEAEPLPEDLWRILEETEAEIQRLEWEGNFEEAERLRQELEAYMGQFEGMDEEDPHHQGYYKPFHEEEPHHQDHFNPFYDEEPHHGDHDKPFYEEEPHMNDFGMDLSPEQLSVILYLIDEINEVLGR